MRRRSDISQGSLKKKKPLRFDRITTIALNLTLTVVFLFMMTYLINNLLQYRILVKEKNTLNENIEMVKDLEQQIKQSRTPEFIEQYARQNLDMLKSGEFVIIISD